MNIKKTMTNALLLTMLMTPLCTLGVHGGGGGRGFHGGGRGFHGGGGAAHRGGAAFHGGGRGYYGHGGYGRGYGRGWGWGTGLGVGLGVGFLASGALDPSWRYYYGNRYWGYDDAIYGWCPFHNVNHGCYYRRVPCADGTYRQVWEVCP